jgi:hypothetical protein
VSRGDGQRGPGITIAAFLLFSSGGSFGDVLDAAEDVARGRRRHPVEILLEVSAAALAAAGLVGQVVAFLGPEVLVALPF